MKKRLILFVFILGSCNSLAQPPAGQPAGAPFVPLDSLWSGMNMAFDALKMTRADLTFRGDYLEEDPYRMRIVNDYMKDPLLAVNFAAGKLSAAEFADLKHEYLLSENNPKSAAEPGPQIRESADTLITPKMRSKLGTGLFSLLGSLMTLATMTDPANWAKLQSLSSAQRDSIVKGFTMLLEENVKDEFLPVDAIDSIQQYEDRYAEKLVRLADGLQGRGRLADEFFDFLSYPLLPDTDLSVAIPPAARGFSLMTKFGKIVIGDTTDDIYSGDLFIVIDPGGNDAYNIKFSGIGHQTYIIDFSGNDDYNLPRNRISPYFLGANMIIDFDGDDIYDSGSWTLGAGLFGIGILWDKDGDDKYFGDTFTQGAGCFGMGLLRDDAGNDSYQAALFAQGFGFVDGIGVLIDNSGNDNYFAGGKYKDVLRYTDHYLSLSQGFAYGIRPKMSAGIGILIDKSGNDVYVSDIFGQGSSYWYGLGILADGAGNDQYVSFQYAQGAATHMTVGILYDVSGDDVYSAKGVSQGCGHDRAAGILVDLDGNDNYSAYDLSQAAGSANGLGILADIRGGDAYVVRSADNTQGFGQPRRDYGSIGIFLDLGGKDGYANGPGRDSTWWSDSKWGVGIDK